MNLVNNIELNRSANSSNFYDKLTDSGEDLKGDDVKGAFLALLQGLVGISNVNVAQNTPVKVAEVETQKDNDSQEESPDPRNDFKVAEKTSSYVSKNKSETSDKNTTDEKSESKEDTLNSSPTDQSTVDVKTATTKTEDSVAQTVENQLAEESTAQTTKTATNQSSPIVPAPVVEEEVASAAPAQEVATSDGKNSLEVTQATAPTPESVDAEPVPVEAEVKKTLSSKSTKETKTSVGDLDSKDENSILDELKHFLAQDSNTKGSSLPQETKQVDNKNLENINATKDALLARLLLGSDQYKTVNGQAKSAKSDTDINVNFGLNLKSNLDRASGEKNSTSPLMRRGVASQEFVDKVKAVLEKVALNKENDTISIKIDPPHLGEVTVKVSQKNGEIFAKLTAENKEIENILKSQSGELNGILQSLGFKPNEVHVQIGSAESQADFSSLNNLNYDSDASKSQDKKAKKSNSGRLGVTDLVGSGVQDLKGGVQESGWVA